MHRPVPARNNLQTSPVTTSSSYVLGNQQSFTNNIANVHKPGPVNRAVNQQAVSRMQQQFQNTRVKNDVLQRQHFRRKALREG